MLVIWRFSTLLLLLQSSATKECSESVLTPLAETLLVSCPCHLTCDISVDINLISKYRNLLSFGCGSFSWPWKLLFPAVCEIRTARESTDPRNSSPPMNFFVLWHIPEGLELVTCSGALLLMHLYCLSSLPCITAPSLLSVTFTHNLHSKSFLRGCI